MASIAARLSQTGKIPQFNPQAVSEHYKGMLARDVGNGSGMSPMAMMAAEKKKETMSPGQQAAVRRSLLGR